MVDFLQDVLMFSVRGALLAWLLQTKAGARPGRLKARAVFAGVTAIYMLFNLVLSYHPYIRRLLYGNGMTMRSSRQSIMGTVACMLLMLAVCMLAYDGGWSVKAYFVTTFFALSELIRFFLYASMNFILGVWLKLWETAWAEAAVSEASYIRILNWTSAYWQLIANTVLTLGTVLLLIQYKKYMKTPGKELERPEMSILWIPSASGICISLLLRSILFSQEGGVPRSIVSESPELYFVIPLLALLCTAAVLVSARNVEALKKEQEERSMILVYRKQLEDMEEQVKDMEHLYDGIRGMRHDMKNYVADMQALLSDTKELRLDCREEMKEYLQGMDALTEQLGMKYHTGNPVTDVVVNRYLRRAEESGIRAECSFLFPQKKGISAFDLSIILNNALENALEAAQKAERPGFIGLRSYMREMMFFVEVENTFDGALSKDRRSGELMSRKEDRRIHGLGLKNIYRCVEKYYGRAEWESRGRLFRLRVMLQSGENL